jgi:hypothetical protein
MGTRISSTDTPACLAAASTPRSGRSSLIFASQLDLLERFLP